MKFRELAASGSGEPSAAIRARQAIDTARLQSARSGELRAALGLAALWRWRGDERRGHELVGETYAGVAEGFDTPDFRQAREVLGRRRVHEASC